MKGQVTVLNLIAILVTFIIFGLVFVPVYLQVSANTEAMLLNNSTNPYNSLTISFLDLAPGIMVLAILMTAIMYAMPRREGERY